MVIFNSYVNVYQRVFMHFHKYHKCMENTTGTWEISFELPSGKLSHNHGKSPCFMGKFTISMVIFHSYFDSLPEGMWSTYGFPSGPDVELFHDVDLTGSHFFGSLRGLGNRWIVKTPMGYIYIYVFQELMPFSVNHFWRNFIKKLDEDLFIYGWFTYIYVYLPSTHGDFP